MSLLVLFVWALSSMPAALAQPWSAWFTALFIAALADLTI